MPPLPGVPGKPKVSPDVASVSLEWTAPTTTAGFAIRGYRVYAQQGGSDGFREILPHSHDAEPRCRLELLPTTWYEFRVAAINVNGVGPPSAASEPTLTRGSEDALGGGGGGGRKGRRRTVQQGGAVTRAQRDALDAAKARETKFAEQLESSKASLRAWERDFIARCGRTPTDDDRAASRVLQEEERTLTRLTHEHALAALDAADANAALQTQEAALAKAQMAAAEKELMALTGRPPAAAELKAMPKYAELLAKRDAALHAAKRQQRKRRALASAEADARRNLAALAEDEAASASVLEAAEAAEREVRAAREDRAARERGGGGGGEGGGGR